MISWEPQQALTVNTPVRLTTPNSYEFVRLRDNPGKTYRLELTMRRRLATVAHRAMPILYDSFETTVTE